MRKSVTLPVWVGAFSLAAYAAFAQPALESGSRVKQELPLLPCVEVASLPDTLSLGERMLMAPLDNTPGDEIVTITSELEAAEDVLKVFTWEKTGIEVQSVTQMKAYSGQPSAADRDGDGRWELYFLGSANRITQLRMDGGELRKSLLPSPGPWTVNGMVFTGLRGASEPEVILAINSRGTWDSDDDAPCDMLVGFRIKEGAWKKVWQQPIVHDRWSLHLMWGDFHPGRGPELVLGHEPLGTGDTIYKVFSWDGKGLVRRASLVTSVLSEGGCQQWAGACTRVTSEPQALMSVVFRRRDKNDDRSTLATGELLHWGDRRPFPVYRLPGHPLVSGDLRGAGIHGFVVTDSEGACRFYEPRPAGRGSRETPREKGSRSH